MIGAIFCPNDGVGDHTFATRQFATEAAKAGAMIRTGAKVVEIVYSNRAASGVRLESGEIVPVSERLVVVANSGAQALLKPILKPHEFGPIWNLMPQMLYVSNPLNKKVNHLLSHAHRRLAVKQIPDGTLMLSGGAHVAYTPEGLWKGSLSALDAERHGRDPDLAVHRQLQLPQGRCLAGGEHVGGLDPADRPVGRAPEYAIRLCLVWPRLRDCARLHQALHGLDPVRGKA